jgi:hypothetical protein
LADLLTPTHTLLLEECLRLDPSTLLGLDSLRLLAHTTEAHLHSTIVTTIELEVPIEIETLEGDPFAANLLRHSEENHHTVGGAGKEMSMTMTGLCKRGHLAHLEGR